jgi:hypothetical protein
LNSWKRWAGLNEQFKGFKKICKGTFYPWTGGWFFVTYGRELEEFKNFYAENPDFRNALSNTVINLRKEEMY